MGAGHGDDNNNNNKNTTTNNNNGSYALITLINANAD